MAPQTADATMRDTSPAAARGALLAAAALWWTVAAASFLLRPLAPIDETRYAAVAWEMWSRGDWLVPALNGAPYSHKPPLLFWAIGAAWSVAGVSAAAARLVPALFGFGALLLLPGLARELWPDREGLARRVPLVFAGLLPVLVFDGALMFDLVLTFFAVAALRAMLLARRRPLAGWSLAGLALGLGILAKGPAALVAPLAVAVTAPWWSETRPAGGWGRWAAGSAFAVVVAAAVGLAWALPAARAGGPAFADALLVHQTEDRLIRSFAHRRPGWWYLPWLPVALYPFSLWPPLWRAPALLRRWAPREEGVRLAIAGCALPLLVFSAISGKQLHYLLPTFPALALLAARVFEERPAVRPGAAALPLVLPALLGAALLFLWGSAGAAGIPHWAEEVAWWAGPLVVALPLFVSMAMAHRFAARPERLAFVAGALVLGLGFAFRDVGHRAYDLTSVARRLAALEREGRPVAVVHPYHGEFHFPGRLTRPLEVVAKGGEAGWLAAHPEGRLVLQLRGDRPPPGTEAEALRDFRGGHLALLRLAGASFRRGEDAAPGGYDPPP